MQKVGIKTLKHDLSRYVRMAAAGETVLVTDRDRVVAELVPPRAPPEGVDAERKWAELIRLGIVTPAKIPPGSPLPRREPSMTFDEMMRDLDESRSER